MSLHLTKPLIYIDNESSHWGRKVREGARNVPKKLSGITGGKSVARVLAGSIAAECGIRRGDRVLEINGTPIRDELDYRFAIADAEVTITVLDARGMGQIVSKELPIFSGFRSLFPGAGEESYLILSVLTEEQVEEAMAMLREVCGDFAEKGTGIAFILPVTRFVGPE